MKKSEEEGEGGGGSDDRSSVHLTFPVVVEPTKPEKVPATSKSEWMRLRETGDVCAVICVLSPVERERPMVLAQSMLYAPQPTLTGAEQEGRWSLEVNWLQGKSWNSEVSSTPVEGREGITL